MVAFLALHTAAARSLSCVLPVVVYVLEEEDFSKPFVYYFAPFFFAAYFSATLVVVLVAVVVVSFICFIG